MRSVYSLLLAGVCASALLGKPQIDEKGVKTFAAVADATVLARGSAFEIRGKEFGPAEAVTAELPYGTELGGVTVNLTTADDAATVAAYVVSATAERIVALVPSVTTAGDYKVTVSFGGETSDPVAVKIADRSFGLLTSTGAAGGMVVGGVVTQKEKPKEEAPAPTRRRADATEEPQPEMVTVVTPITYSAPAKPGSKLVLSAMGLGPIDTADNELQVEGNLIEGVVMMLGGQEIPVTYIGRDGQKPGYDKVEVTLPEENVPAGCSVEFQIRIGEETTLTATLPIAVGDAACEHPLGITPTGLDSLASGGTIALGSFVLTKSTIQTSLMGISIDTTTENAGGGFTSYDAAGLAAFMASSGTSTYLLNPNGCSVYIAPETSETPAAEMLDAGDPLKLTGAGGAKDMPRTETNNYYVQLSAPSTGGGSIPGFPTIPGMPGIGVPAASGYLSAGEYTLTGTGGKDIGPFTATTKLVAPITWSNRDAISSINRSADLTVTWTGGQETELVTVSGFSRGKAPEDSTKTLAKVFLCFAPANAGKIVVPSSILQQMPAAEGTPSGIPTSADAVTLSALSVVHSNGATIPRFQAPIRNAGEETERVSEYAVFGFAYTSTKTLAYK